MGEEGWGRMNAGVHTHPGPRTPRQSHLLKGSSYDR
jgi:hypothetical protein